MNKARLVSELSTQLSLTKYDTEERLAHLIDLMCEELDQQNTIHVPGLGQFETRERASYVAYNPHYKKKMHILFYTNLYSTSKKYLIKFFLLHQDFLMF